MFSNHFAQKKAFQYKKLGLKVYRISEECYFNIHFLLTCLSLLYKIPHSGILAFTCSLLHVQFLLSISFITDNTN